MSFYSQFGEDKWIAENIPLTQKGVFVDVGASDGVKFSNTLYFEELGWTGICIEAHPSSYNGLLSRRQNALHCAVYNYNGLVKMYVDSDPDYSHITSDNGLLTPCLTLYRILSQLEYRNIDLLSVDVEGKELEVLQGLDFNHYKPTIIIVEYLTPGLPPRQADLQLFFSTLPYKLVHETDANLIFQKQ